MVKLYLGEAFLLAYMIEARYMLREDLGVLKGNIWPDHIAGAKIRVLAQLQPQILIRQKLKNGLGICLRVSEINQNADLVGYDLGGMRKSGGDNRPAHAEGIG